VVKQEPLLSLNLPDSCQSGNIVQSHVLVSLGIENVLKLAPSIFQQIDEQFPSEECFFEAFFSGIGHLGDLMVTEPRSWPFYPNDFTPPE
jgi:hypothetical protein